MLPEIMADPVVRKKFLEEYGLSYMFTESNKDVQSAEYAIGQMLQGMYPPILDIFNPDIQLMVIVRYMKDPKYLELDDNIKMLFDRRKNEYMSKIAESMARAPLITGEPDQPQPQGKGGISDQTGMNQNMQAMKQRGAM
jgi:hypothetical protein